MPTAPCSSRLLLSAKARLYPARKLPPPTFLRTFTRPEGGGEVAPVQGC